jgi:hypothetical protein
MWSAPAEGKGSMAVAILFDPRSLIRITEDADNYLIILREQPGVPFVYYSGATWDRGPDFQDHYAWIAYVRAQHPDFDPRH